MSTQLARLMDDRDEEPYIPRLVISAGVEINRANQTNGQVDWASIRSDDPRIVENIFYTEGISTPEPGKFSVFISELPLTSAIDPETYSKVLGKQREPNTPPPVKEEEIENSVTVGRLHLIF